jgi:hypothetical protein
MTAAAEDFVNFRMNQLVLEHSSRLSGVLLVGLVEWSLMIAFRTIS